MRLREDPPPQADTLLCCKGHRDSNARCRLTYRWTGESGVRVFWCAEHHAYSYVAPTEATVTYGYFIMPPVTIRRSTLGRLDAEIVKGGTDEH